MKNWYIIQSHSSFENKVANSIKEEALKAKLDDKTFALKIRRTDSSRSNVNTEVEYLRLANSINIGPKLKDYTDNMILMELIPDLTLATWIKNFSDTTSIINLKKIIGDLLHQCRGLDNIGLDHGELSNLFKHVFVGEKISILDFCEVCQVHISP